jgi:hypothetical protein
LTESRSDGAIVTDPTSRPHPLLALSDSDLEFVLRLVLASGSLKELAQAYGVSYPTIRGKLDRLIAHLQQILDGQPPDAMANLLADFLEKGEVSPSIARSILELHRKEVSQTKEK